MKLWQKIALLSVGLVLTTNILSAESTLKQVLQAEKTEMATLNESGKTTAISKADYEKLAAENQIREATINQKIAVIFRHNYYEFPETTKLVNEILQQLNSANNAMLKAKAVADKADWPTAMLWAQKCQQAQNRAITLTLQTHNSLKTQNTLATINITVNNNEQNKEELIEKPRDKTTPITATEVATAVGKEDNLTRQGGDSDKEVMAIEENDNETPVQEPKPEELIETSSDKTIPITTEVATAVGKEDNLTHQVSDSDKEVMAIEDNDNETPVQEPKPEELIETSRNTTIPIATEVAKIAEESITTQTAIEENDHEEPERITTEISDSEIQKNTVTQSNSIQPMNTIEANNIEETSPITQETTIVTQKSENQVPEITPIQVNENREPVVSIIENNDTHVKAKLTDVPIDGATLYTSKGCIACHGIDGKNPISAIYPNLAGQNKDYIIAQITDIKNGVRHNGQSAAMKTLMPIISDTEIAMLASWLASLPVSYEPVIFANDRVEQGAKLYLSKTCMTCHGETAQTPIKPNYPKLTGQSPQYIIAQMKDIKSGARDNGQTSAMKTIMLTVNEEDMLAIAQWLNVLNVP